MEKKSNCFFVFLVVGAKNKCEQNDDAHRALRLRWPRALPDPLPTPPTPPQRVIAGAPYHPHQTHCVMVWLVWRVVAGGRDVAVTLVGSLPFHGVAAAALKRKCRGAHPWMLSAAHLPQRGTPPHLYITTQRAHSNSPPSLSLRSSRCPLTNLSSSLLLQSPLSNLSTWEKVARTESALAAS